MNVKVEEKFAGYPKGAQTKLQKLRKLIYKVAEECQITDLEETLKWGEPSYLTKFGSTIRIDWKPSAPKHYAMYFHCQSKLVATFKEVYPHTFHYQGNRAIVLDIKAKLPEKELKHCITLALTYHKVKHLPLLGA